MTRIQKYIDFCEKNKQVPLFMLPQWLDIVYGARGWDVTLFEQGDSICGIMPYGYVYKGPFKGIAMPVLTPYSGYHLFYPEPLTSINRLSFERKALTELYGQLPGSAFVEQVLQAQYTNFLPQEWLGYRQSGRISYVIEDITDVDTVWNNLGENIRREIKKARKSLTVCESDDARILYDQVILSLEKKKRDLLASKERIQKMIDFGNTRECGKLYVIKDSIDTVYAAGFVMWDKDTAWFIMRGGASEKLRSGAMSLLVWHMIESLKDKTRSFDFMGSHFREVERFVRYFGASQQARHFIYKYNNPLVRLWKAIR